MKNPSIPVVLLDAAYGLTFQTLPALAQARRYAVTALSLNQEMPHFRHSRQCTYLHKPDWDWQRGAEQLSDVALQNPGAILFPVGEVSVTWITEHQSELSASWRLPPLNELSTLRSVVDKAKFAEFAQSIGLLTPHSLSLPCESKVLDSLRYPVLLKPREGDGGRGIRKFDNRTALAARLMSLNPTDAANLYLQEWVEGEDFSCGLFCQDGEIHTQITYKCLTREKEYGAFTAIQAVEDAEIADVTAKLIRALR